MLAKKKNTQQLSFYNTFKEQLNHQHPLYILADRIAWNKFDDAFRVFYSETMGAPAKPIRLMVSLLILKQLRNLSDESVVVQWSENSYFQYFSGEEVFCNCEPCSSTELVEFRKRIGEAGIELIFKESIRINGKDSDDSNLSADSTIQEKNITYPTDDKLYKKIIKKCQNIADEESVELRQSYRRTVKQLSITQRLRRNKGGDVKARKASKKIKTIAGRLVRDIERKLTADSLSKHSLDLLLFKRILNQKKTDSNKIYSIHEPMVKCYSKGKEHKKFEFGSKACFLITQSTGVIVGALNFSETIHDSKTLETALIQHEKLTGIQAKTAFVDRGYAGPRKIGETIIHMPRPNKSITKTTRKRHKRRAAIEPVIGHLKHDYRMMRNYLKGVSGDTINVMMAAAAMNFKRQMNKWKKMASLFPHFLTETMELIGNYLVIQLLEMTF